MLRLKNRITQLSIFLSFCLFVSCDISKKKEEGIKVNSIPTSVSIDSTSPNTLPDIKGINHLGDTIEIRRLNSKFILLEFWASWCPPCRKANPALLQVYDKYHAKGFEIFSISLDHEDSKWKNAIAKDGLHWPYHMCEFVGWDSYWAAQYGIESIPNNILFDSTGKIIARGLEPDMLDKALESLVSK